MFVHDEEVEMRNFGVGPHIHHYDKLSVQGGQWFQRRLKYVMFADGQADRGRVKGVK
jgi:hypothetical protein